MATTARSPTRCSAMGRETSRGARWRRGGSVPSRPRSIQATSRRAATVSETRRSQISPRTTSSDFTTARDPASSSFPVPPISVEASRAAAPTSTAASASPGGTAAIRPFGSGSSAACSAAAEVWRRSSADLAWRATPRPTRSTVEAESSTEAAEVTRGTRSWASSTTSSPCSGRAPGDPPAATPSMAWLVITTSARWAAPRAFSAKQCSRTGQAEPRHSSLVTDTCRQARSETPGTRSSRSPVSVSAAQARTRTTCSPSPPRGPSGARALAPSTWKRVGSSSSG